VAAVKSDPNLDLSNLTDREMNDLLAVAGIGKGGLPDRTADINGILDTLDATSREKILTSFVNDLFTQSEF
jgi:sphinganine-1-phosphate aldolase